MPKKTNSNKPSDSNYGNNLAKIALGLVILLIIALGLMSINKQATIISKYELLEKIDNQACRYLDGQKAVNGSFDLEPSAPTDSPRLKYWCFTGQLTEAKNIHSKPIESYELGAQVLYFSTNEEALKYAEQQLNPLRYWGVDEEGQKNGIPQTSHFTFIVSDVPEPYFDAYTVKANAVLRVSLPCRSTEIENGIDPCAVQAEEVLNREMAGINVL